MRSELRTALAVLATSVVLLASATMAIAADVDPAAPEPAVTTTAPSPSPSGTTPEPTETTPTPDPTATPELPETTPPVPTGTFSVNDGQLRWGVNNESNNRAFAPGTVNFFSAGKIPNPGRGGVIMPQGSWKQTDGNVSIEKYLNGSWSPATWAGLRTTSTGATMAGTNGPFSNHEVVISGGTGTVDITAGSASIQWTGSFTSLYYSGYSFFYVTDPTLTVRNGIGTLTATLSGYGSSMDDMEKWEAVAPVPNVVLANLGKVDLAADLGFTATPAYSGVAVSIPGDQAPQVRSGAHWGSFPQSFVDYQLSSGSGAYWYSSGGSADAHKTALPVTISYAASAPVKVAPKPAKVTKTPTVTNDAPQAPDPSGDPAVNPFEGTGTGTAPSPALTLPAPAAGTAVQTGATLTQFRPASTVIGARMRAADPSGVDSAWILGGVLLAAAGLLAASPFAYSAVRKTS